MEDTENPWPKSRLRGTKAEGKRFERLVALRLRTLFPQNEVQHNPWYRYGDELGDGLASPDVIVIAPEWLLLCECKRTFRPEAFEKLTRFYLPLVVARWPGRYYGMIQFCANLSPCARGISLTDPASVLANRPASPQLVFWP